MAFIFSCIIQACVVLFVIFIIFETATVLFNWTRIIVYRVTLGKVDMLLNAEKIRFGLIKQNVIPTNVEVINKVYEPVGSYEEFESMWERNNEVLDIKLKQSKTDPDEIFFQGRVKRRR
jgi:hypothetical protein